jgi:hypothetical protein
MFTKALTSTLLAVLVFASVLPRVAFAQTDDDDFNPYESAEWMKFTDSDWEQKAQTHYDNSDNAHHQASEWARKNGMDTPEFHQTMDKIKELQDQPQTEEVKTELNQLYSKLVNDMNKWIDGLPKIDDIKGIGLQLLIQQATILAAKYEESIYQMMKSVLPGGSGIPVTDPIRNNGIEDDNTVPNHKTLINQLVEMFLNEMIKKDAEGTQTLQRNNIERMKEAGAAKYLKLAAMNWELLKSQELKSLQSIADFSGELQSWYQYATTSIKDGQKLYGEITKIPSNVKLPTKVQLQALNKHVVTNQLALAEMVDTRKKTLATTYNQLAERTIQKAKDLESKLALDNHFKMTEGERLQAQMIVNGYYQEAMRIKAKADRLVQDSYNSKTAQQKQAAMQTYQLLQSLSQQSEP